MMRFVGSPKAEPITEPEPWESETCGSCKHCGCVYQIGCDEPLYVCFTGDLDMDEVTASKAACDGWEKA